MGRVVQVVGVAALVMWAWAQEDQLAVETSISRASVAGPPDHPAFLLTQTPADPYRNKPPVRRHFAQLLLPARPTASPARSPVATIGQQVKEYVRRISDYFYWIFSGDPPITRKRNRVTERAPPRGRPIRRDYARAPIRSRLTQGGGPIRRRRTWPVPRGGQTRHQSRLGDHRDTRHHPHHTREGERRTRKRGGRGGLNNERNRRLSGRRNKVNNYYIR